MSQPAQKVDVAAASAALGCSFANPSLLETAFTHQSYAHGRPGDEDNQRLEFLGDAVLGLLAADALYRADPAADEGVLTARRSALVSGAALARLAARLDIARFMRFSPGVRDTVERSGERTSAALVEAVFGAAWLDGGCAAATALFDRLFATEVARLLADDAPASDPRGRLQSLAHQRGLGTPLYEITDSTGDGRSFTFTARVTLGDASASASGPNKRKAYAAAAENLLAALRAR